MGDAQKSDVNLSQIIHSVVNIVKPLSKYRNREIKVDADVSIFAIGNEQEIKQVALNLITNALSCVEENGIVRVELKQEDGFAELVVTDDGCGMTSEVQKHLFEPFFTRRRNGQGTGLGLSITYQIIEEHGGKITAHSDGPGFGSEFRVCLPLAIPDPAIHEKTAA
jgi:two-component system NtrC family sensor kinase